MKVSFSVSIWHRSRKFRKNRFQKLDHLTCSKCLFMTLLYNMYKPINFSELRYMSNGLTFEMLNGNSRNVQGCCQMTR